MEMKLTIAISVMFFLNIQSFGCCQESQGVVVGLSTSILCSLSARRNIIGAPFWFINGTVYELFSIPRHFPFIPVVDSYSHLNIPNIYLELNNTMFQCSRFSGNGLINGTLVQLAVFPSHNSEDSSGGLQIRELLMIDYQELLILENMISVSWFLSNTCSEDNIVVQGYILDTEPVLAPDYVFPVKNSASFVTINHTNSSISYRLEIQNETESACTSMQSIYYRFEACTLKSIFNPGVYSSLCYPIPQTDVCSSGLNFVWASREAGRSCVCPAHNSSAGRWVFESCVEGCRDAVLTPVLTEQGFICISNLTSSLNGSLFHFVCSTELCGNSLGADALCFLKTVIASHITTITDFFEELELASSSEEDRNGSTYEEAVPTDCPTSAVHIPFLISVVFAVAITILSSVVIAVLSLCVLKYRKMARQLKLELPSNSAEKEAVSSPPIPPMTTDDTIDLPVPEYEDIQEVRRHGHQFTEEHVTLTLGADSSTSNTGEPDTKTDYQFTMCPAYAFT